MTRQPDARIGVVVITHNRRDEVLGALARLRELPEQPRVLVVDNASHDGTADAIRSQHPWAELVASPTNLGAVGRNVGVDRLHTPYVAFCDDDTWWEPGSLREAADVLQAHPRAAVLTGRIIVEPRGQEDPIVAELRHSPVPTAADLPGPALGSFLAGASVVRRDAFRAIGGFHPRIWLGGEEELLAADLSVAGWELCFLETIAIHHHPSKVRDPHRRRRDGIRNTLWFIWLRRPLPAALRRTWNVLRSLPRDRVSAAGIWHALRGASWVLRERTPLPPHAEERFLALEDAQRSSTARSYVS
ncbi:Glycosyltransferase, GT2 family [Promicromonospora umidemergens]|uniref:Glycosyltransferase n=1 Tax=Promicromonospora umidemergens TaxID=629679 RepID=A0ABP8Y1D5_9MICO|nr:glycosyltransferase [Promicromonospora umidemergens]MCP2284156.1 Glycosyltransferase, GT2 family [Promicromonospora umidemergens]